MRRAGAGADPIEAIAVLSDVTRLKTQQIELEILARDRELMFSLSGVGIAFVRDGRIQRANQALAELTGWSVEDLSSLELASLFVDAADFRRRWPQEERDLRLHGRWSGERQMRRRDGRALWVQVSKRFVTEGDPAGGIIASYVNVDARHRAERAVALQAERTRSILDSVLVGIVTVGPQGIEWMNRSARRMFGGDLADFVANRRRDRRDPRARSSVPAHRVPRPSWSKARPRPSSAASGRATGASSGSSAMRSRPIANRPAGSSPTRCSTSSAGARPRRGCRRRSRRCSTSSRRRRWRSR